MPETVELVHPVVYHTVDGSSSYSDSTHTHAQQAPHDLGVTADVTTDVTNTQEHHDPGVTNNLSPVTDNIPPQHNTIRSHIIARK